MVKKKKMLLGVLAVVLCFLLIQLNSNRIIKKQREIAANLKEEDVLQWLEKNKVYVPPGLEKRDGFEEYVLGIIRMASEGNGGNAVSYTPVRDFRKAVRNAAGYQFDRDGRPIN